MDAEADRSCDFQDFTNVKVAAVSRASSVIHAGEFFFWLIRSLYLCFGSGCLMVSTANLADTNVSSREEFQWLSPRYLILIHLKDF